MKQYRILACACLFLHGMIYGLSVRLINNSPQFKYQARVYTFAQTGTGVTASSTTATTVDVTAQSMYEEDIGAVCIEKIEVSRVDANLVPVVVRPQIRSKSICGNEVVIIAITDTSTGFEAVQQKERPLIPSRFDTR